MYWLTKFNVLGTDYTLPSPRPQHYVGVGSVDRGIFTPLPTGGVYDNYGIDPAPVSQQQIPWRGALALRGMTAAQLETYEANLRSLLGKRGSLYRTWDSSSNAQFCDARLVSYDATRGMPGNYLDVDLTFQMISPLWNGAAHTHTFTKAEITTASGIVSLTNSGNANQDNVVITITAQTSAITALDIKKESATGATIYDHLTWDGTLVAGDSLVIDTGAYSVMNDGTSDYSSFVLGASHREDHWFRLWASANRIEIAITGGGDTSTVKFEYYDAWK